MSGLGQAYGVFIVRFAGELANKSGKTHPALSRVFRRNSAQPELLAAMACADLRAWVI